MAVAARNAEGHGWLRPALGVMELSQSITQVLLVDGSVYLQTRLVLYEKRFAQLTLLCLFHPVKLLSN